MLYRLSFLLALFLAFVPELQGQSPVTFNNQVVRIFQQHCQVCHRPGNIAPFPLLTYQDAVSRTGLIRNAVESKLMPPWKPVNAHGVFKAERAMTDSEIQTIVQWANSGAPEGSPNDLPPAATFPDTWALGSPDKVVQPPEAYQLPLNSSDIYRCFPMMVNTQSDTYVRGYEVLPTNRTIVHHVLLFLDEAGQSPALDDADPGPGYTCFGGTGFLIGVGGLGGWVPGASAEMFPLGTGVRIKAGARIVMQVHYSNADTSPGSTAQFDQTRVGLYLSPAALQQLTFFPIVNPIFRIPAGESRYQVRALSILPSQVDVVGIAPHMHLLGREAKITARLPSGETRELIRIDDWDFHWQGNYTFNQPVTLPAGTILEMLAYYDNSTNNPKNPSNPPVSVAWGERTVDEMCLTFLTVKSPGTPSINTVPFSISDRSTTSVVTQEGPATTQVGYARISNAAGSVPAGLAIFGYRQNGILISEAGVPASGLVTRARVYDETGGGTRSGLAIANPNSDPAAISFYFTDASGQDIRTGSTSVPANGQIAGFLDEPPFNGASPFVGSFTITSTRPVSVVALRGNLNERSEFLLTTMPVTDLASTSTASTVFPHFADGAGWTTQIVLVNPTDNTISGSLRFTDRTGQPASLTLNGETVAGSFPYSLPARAAKSFLTSGASNTARVGAIWVLPSQNNPAPGGSLVFSYRASNIRVTEAGVPASIPGSAFRLYAEASVSVQSGLAITNASSSPATVRLELINLNGSSVAGTTLTIGANGQTGAFLDQIPGLEMVSLPFQGLLRITSASPIAVVGLRGRYNERGDFLITTTPPVSEQTSASSGDAYFPHFADAGGYTTQFILFSSGPGASASGSVRFMKQDGQPLDLKLR
jgi:mono/diheme cytochrome c family protein